MSAIVKTKRRSNPSISTAALWMVVGLAVVFFLVRYGQELLLAHELNDKATAQRSVNAQLRDENSRLEAMLQYYRSDKYIEQRAREDLNLKRPEEEVLIPVAPAQDGTTRGAAPPQSSAAVPPVEMPTPELANWQKWLGLFTAAP